MVLWTIPVFSKNAKCVLKWERATRRRYWESFMESTNCATKDVLTAGSFPLITRVGETYVKSTQIPTIELPIFGHS
jgi:hypothetical protein